MSDLQRDIALIDTHMDGVSVLPTQTYKAWQRLKPRLTPDRTAVAKAIDAATRHALSAGLLIDATDAAIAAMGETP